MMQLLVITSLRSLFATILIFLMTASMVYAASVPRFAYVANPYDYTVSGYYLDKDGMMFPNGMVYTGAKFPSTLIIHPSGKFLYSVSRTIDTAQIYQIDPVTGRLTETPQSGFPTGLRSPFSYAFHPSGKFLYAAGRGGYVAGFAVNPQTGALSYVPHTPFKSGERTRHLTMHPSGKFVYASNAYSNNISAYRVDQQTGELHELKQSPFFAGEAGVYEDVYAKLPDLRTKPAHKGGLPYYVTCHPSGKYVYVTNYAAATVSVFQVDPETGNLQLLGTPVKTGETPYAVAVHPSGKFVFISSWGSNSLWVYSIDLETGALTPIKGLPFDVLGTKPVDISFSEDGSRVFVANNGTNSISILDVDVATGQVKMRDLAMTRAGAIDIELLSQTAPVSVVPGYLFLLDKQQRQLINYHMDPVSGGLQEISRIATGDQPATIAEDPLDRFVYVANTASNNVSGYSIVPQTGVLQEITGSPFNVGKNPDDIVIDANGWYFYSISHQTQEMTVYLIHFTKGQLAEVQGSPLPLGKKPFRISRDQTARFIYISSQSDDSVNVFRYRTAVTPSIFDINEFGSPFEFKSLPSAVINDPTGRFLMVLQQQTNQVAMFFVHAATGGLVRISDNLEPFALQGKKPVDAVFHPSGKYAYVLNKDSKNISQLKVGRLYGKLSRINKPIATRGTPRAMAIDPSGKFLYVINEKQKSLHKFGIDARTGELSDASDIALSFIPQAIKISRELQ